jgi:hypothetical protein
VDRYEELRAAVVDGRADGHRFGLGVLMRSGMAGWMQAWASTPGTRAPARPAATLPAHASELVAVLAGMALGLGAR